jgi:ABC-type multidrug transport system fused ATPase/permease subunit
MLKGKEILRIRKENDSLTKRLFLMCYPYILIEFSCSFFSSILTFAGPYYLYKIVKLIADDSIDRMNIVPYLYRLFASSLGKTILDGQCYFYGRRCGIICRTIIIDELYKKSLHRVQGVSAEGENASLGKIVTLMSVDTESIRQLSSNLHLFLIEIPISAVVSISSLYFLIGWSSFVGILLVFAIGPISKKLSQLMIKYQKLLLENTDKRVSMINEMLQGVRIIKYFAWEEHFIEQITQAREKELNSLKRLWNIYLGFNTLGAGSGIAICFTTFCVYTFIAKKSLDPAIAFTAVNLLTVVSNLLSYLPAQLTEIFNGKVSLDRISDFLKETNIEKYARVSSIDDYEESNGSIDIRIGFSNATLQYHPNDNSNDQNKFILKNINVNFPINQLSLITGSTGQGKSSVLLGLLGELQLESGQIHFPSGNHHKVDPRTGLSQTVAYVAQSAWLLNATIRDNILFGEPYEEKRYNSVIRQCALTKDLDNLEGGDLTEIGEKGINLSGGQKQRISLARACYSRAAFVLLDDPLSAVDAPTARFLLHKCILGLLANRTVILVSHATQLVLPHSTYVVVMDNGEITLQGTPEYVIKNSKDDKLDAVRLEKDIFNDLKEGSADDEKKVSSLTLGTTLVQEEEQTTGSIKLKLYLAYFKAAGGHWIVLLLIATICLSHIAQFGNDWWLKHWTDTKTASLGYSSLVDKPNKLISGLGASFFPISKVEEVAELLENENTALFYIIIYALFGIGIIISKNLRLIVTFFGALKASHNLHRNLLKSVLYSPLRFFEVTPVGRILNRFSKDIQIADNQVLLYITLFFEQLMQIITILVIIASVAPLFLIVVPFLMYAFYTVAKYYLMTSRELKRFESTTRSPIYAQFSETLNGVSTIRAYSAEDRFLLKNQLKVDTNNKPYFFMWAANRWLTVRTDILSALVVSFAALFIVLGNLGPGWAALVLNYSMQFTEALLLLVRVHAEMEMNLNCIERIEEYTILEQEPLAIIEDSRPPPDWPRKGSIQVKDLSIRYAADLPDVLNGISFEVLPHEKVAVVGRTGV